MVSARLPEPVPEPVTVTDHAVDRWIERVQPCSRDEARAAIRRCGRAIHAATSFGARIVLLPHHVRLVLAPGEPKVVTVLASGMIEHSDRRWFPTLALPEDV